MKSESHFIGVKFAKATVKLISLGPAPPAPLALLNAAFFHLTGVAPGDGTGVKFFEKDSEAYPPASPVRLTPLGWRAGQAGCSGYKEYKKILLILLIPGPDLIYKHKFQKLIS